MFSALLVVAGLSFSPIPPIPRDIVDFRFWPLEHRETARRTAAGDAVSPGVLPFITARGICADPAPPDCAYTVRWEDYRQFVGGKMYGFGLRWVILGDNGKREEGIFYFDQDRMAVIYYRKGDRWLTEEPNTLEMEQTADFGKFLSQAGDAKVQARVARLGHP
jgi:hypothetical protein